MALWLEIRVLVTGNVLQMVACFGFDQRDKQIHLDQFIQFGFVGRRQASLFAAFEQFPHPFSQPIGGTKLQDLFRPRPPGKEGDHFASQTANLRPPLP